MKRTQAVPMADGSQATVTFTASSGANLVELVKRVCGSDSYTLGQFVLQIEHDADCSTCGEVGGVEGECPKSTRSCGHHCNHIWDQDCCHWCGVEIDEDGQLPERNGATV